MSDDMKQAIIPKSDQLNSDDLITGPMTIKITGVTVRGGQEQPVAISFEGDNGKPYKACKSMCRVMVAAWGPDSSKYVGRSMTLYRDPSVKWGGMAVGGIRISHMSHIDENMTMALTVTRANKKPYTVKVLSQNAAPPSHPPVASSPADEGAGAAPSDGPIIPYSEMIKLANTLPELQSVWKKIPREDQEIYLAAKDKRKAELTEGQS